MILNEASKDVEISIIYDPYKRIAFWKLIKIHLITKWIKLALADITHFIMCNGGEHGYARYKIANELKKLGLKPVDVISPHAILDDIKQKGEGLQAMPGAVVHKFSTIGDQCIINTNATVDHDCIIGNGVHVMGGASIAGQVEVGDFSTIGTNATVLLNIKIGKAHISVQGLL